jgi:hypothetical protein
MNAGLLTIFAAVYAISLKCRLRSIFINPSKARRCNMKVSKAIHSYQEYHRANSKKKYAEKL